MELEQAIFTSTRSQSLSGYHLVARSAGIDESTGQALCRWSPSHDSLLSRSSRASSLNYFPVDQDRAAISRTVLGGPEYSGRGGLQTVTMILVFTRSQMAGYDYDPVALSETALSQGYLSFFRSHKFHERAVLPDRNVKAPLTRTRLRNTTYYQNAITHLQQSKSIAFVDSPHIRRDIQNILLQLPSETRWETFFTTGLKPCSQRPFRIHHVRKPGIDIRAYFSRQGVVSIPAASELATSSS